jgi:hypothetical protein
MSSLIEFKQCEEQMKLHVIMPPANAQLQSRTLPANWERSESAWSLAGLQRLLPGDHCRGSDPRQDVSFQGLKLPTIQRTLKDPALTPAQHPDREWGDRLHEIQASHASNQQGQESAPKSAFNARRLVFSRRFGKQSMVPPVQTLQATEVLSHSSNLCLYSSDLGLSGETCRQA